MFKDMLGVAVRKLVTLPSDSLGLVCDLLEKLADPSWVKATKLFLRKENPWPSVIVRAVPFDPVSFLGKGWKIEEQDKRSLALDSIDLTKVNLETCLKKGENNITSFDKTERLIKTGYIRLDNRFLLAMLRNQKLIPDSWKKLTGIYNTRILFDGTILRSPTGMRGILYLYWNGQRWLYECHWLDNSVSNAFYSAVFKG